jgi:hypothetical protein
VWFATTTTAVRFVFDAKQTVCYCNQFHQIFDHPFVVLLDMTNKRSQGKTLCVVAGVSVSHSDNMIKCKIHHVSIHAMNHKFLPSFIMKHSNMDMIKKNRVITDLLNSELDAT